MIMQKKFVLALPVLLLIALSASGIAMARWSDSVKLSGTVTTATFCVEIWRINNSDPRTTNDSMSDPEDCTNFRTWELDKNVGSTIVTNITDSNTIGISVEIENGYPGYTVDIGMNLHNCGTLPWNITSVDFTYENGTVITTITQAGPVCLDLNEDGVNDVAVNFMDNFNTQFHYCQAAEESWAIKILEGAPQNATMAFNIMINICAFNAIPETE